jgi:hypothetical protein
MTSSQRLIKKAIIMFTVAIIILVIYKLLFPPIPEPCFNGIYDIGEDKVDCGGICQKICPPPPMPPNVSEIKIISSDFVRDGENNYDLVAKIINNNSSWGVSSVDYVFLIYKKNGEIIKTKKESTYIMPNGFLEEDGIKYIIQDNFKSDSEIEKVDIELSESSFIWKEIKDPRDIPNYNSKIINIKDKKGEFILGDNEFYYVYGVTENSSRYSFYRVDINVVIYNSNGKPIAVGKTNQWTVSGGSGWEFRIFWDNPFSKDIDLIDYQAQTNVFDSENFMEEYGTGERYMIPR